MNESQIKRLPVSILQVLRIVFVVCIILTIYASCICKIRAHNYTSKREIDSCVPIGDQSVWSRDLYARKNILPTDSCLEISPLYFPLLKQSSNVKNVDVQSREANIARYNTSDSFPRKSWGSKFADHFAETHYIWKGGSYLNLVGSKRFKHIVSSHVLEHIPDLISYLEDMYDIMEPGGELRMMIPDMSKNWDFRRKPTELSDIIGNHIEKRTHPGSGDYFEQVLLAPLSQISEHDPANYVRHPGLYDEIVTTAAIKEALRHTLAAASRTAAGSYEDAHVNRWTCRSFCQHMQILKDVGLIRLELVNVVPVRPDGGEFLVTLKKRK